MFANMFDHSDLITLVWDPFIEQGDSHLIKVAVGISELIDQQHSIESFEMLVVIFKNAKKCIEVSKLKQVLSEIDDQSIKERIKEAKMEYDFINS